MDRAREAERARQTRQEIPGFGVLLRKHRLDAGLTQDALAERARISVRAIADLERGARRYPYAETTARLAAALDLTDDQGDMLSRASRRPKTRAAVTYIHASDAVGLRGAHVSAEGVRHSALDKSDLPRQLTSFIGREEALEHLMEVVPEARLVTLTGPGGVGKTRLALELGRHLHASDYDAVYFLDLAPLHDGGQVEQALIAALGGRQDASEPAVETIRSLLGGGRTLLVLDNCEHLVEPVACLVDLLLRGIATMSVLATSREPLGVQGEARWAVPPLGETDSIRLFVARARLVDARFAPAGGDAAVVMQLCRILDGLPLAIELAAARVAQLPVGEILVRLGKPFALLSRLDRGIDARYRTLEAAINWSYDLLQMEERGVLTSLSVFAGGFEPAAAEHVAGCPFDLLGRLVDKSMVVAGTGIHGRARYRLLETIRVYAHARLEEANGANSARTRHFEWFADLCSTAAEELLGPRQGTWIDHLNEELGNIRVALEWGSARRPEVALGMCVNLRRFWNVTQPSEGRSWLKRLARLAPDAAVQIRAAALCAAADFAAEGGEPEVARVELEEALRLWRQVDDPGGLAQGLLVQALTKSGTAVLADRRIQLEEAVSQARRSGKDYLLADVLIFLGVAHQSQGNRQKARKYLKEAVATARTAADVRTLSLALELLGHLEEVEGHFDEALRDHTEALEHAIEARDPKLQTHALIHLGLVRFGQHRDSEAQQHFEAALATRSVGYHQCGAISGLAQVAAREGSFERALRLHGAASPSRWDTVLYRTSRADLEKQVWIGAARRALGRQAAANIWHAGATMTPEEAISYALSDADEPAEDGALLTQREKQIMALVGRGLRNRQIAEQLAISARMVAAHIDHIRTKLGHASRDQFAAWARAQDDVPAIV